MEWAEDGFILGLRKHGESSGILDVMTRGRGRCSGLVRGARSRRNQPLLQPGNSVHLVWRARLEEHLGQFTLEADRMRAAELMTSRAGVYGVQWLAELLRLLPEREPHQRLYDASLVILDHLTAPDILGELFVRFELALLEDLGFGLDLTCCAATGVRDDLIYISPKSGRAVSRTAGEPYKDRLLPLPAFFLKPGMTQAGSHQALQDAFQVSGYFLGRHIWGARGLTHSDMRDSLLKLLLKTQDDARKTT